jgi:hypothetical protein
MGHVAGLRGQVGLGLRGQISTVDIRQALFGLSRHILPREEF